MPGQQDDDSKLSDGLNTSVDYEGRRYHVQTQCSTREAPVIESGAVTTFFAREWDPERVPEVVASLSDDVYITIDLDGLDPSVVPGVGTPEPGGLSWRDTLAVLRAVAAARRVVGCDVVELLPLPGSTVSEFAAARLCYKLLGAVALSQGWFQD